MRRFSVIKSNISLQIAAVLLLLVILTTGLYARYASSAGENDFAKVAYCSVERTQSAVAYYDEDDQVISDEDLAAGVSMGVHDADRIKKVVYEAEFTVESEVTLKYTVKIENLPAGAAEGMTVTLDDGSVKPVFSDDGTTCYFDCGMLSPTTEKTVINHTVTFEVDLDGSGELGNITDGTETEGGYSFAPIVKIDFAQVGGKT